MAVGASFRTIFLGSCQALNPTKAVTAASFRNYRPVRRPRVVTPVVSLQAFVSIHWLGSNVEGTGPFSKMMSCGSECNGLEKSTASTVCAHTYGRKGNPVVPVPKKRRPIVNGSVLRDSCGLPPRSKIGVRINASSATFFGGNVFPGELLPTGFDMREPGEREVRIVRVTDPVAPRQFVEDIPSRYDEGVM